MNSHLSSNDFTVAPGEGGNDLLSFLAKQLKTSKKKAKKLLDDHSVLVNGRRVWMARHVLQANQKVSIVVPGVSHTPGKPIPIFPGA